MMYNVPEWKQILIVLIIAASFVPAFRVQAADNNDYWDKDPGARILIYSYCGSLIFIAGPTAYLADRRLDSNEPSSGLGAFGLLWGGYTVLVGAAITVIGSNESEDGIMAIGIAASAVGGICAYYGVKEIMGVSRKNDAEKKTAMIVEPLLMSDQRHGVSAGIQLVVSF